MHQRIQHHQASPIAPDQSGAALVIAVLILLVISIISVTSASRSVLEEQMSSNQYIQTNTFLAAEAGISQVQQEIINNVDVRQDLADAPNKACKPDTDTRWTRVSDTKNSAEFCLQLIKNNADNNQNSEHATNEVFQVLSHGRTKMGSKTLSQRTLGVAIKPTNNGSSPFVSAVIGAQGVSLQGSATIDSYNSNYGQYGHSVTVDSDTFTNSSSSDNHGDKLNGLSARTCTPGAPIQLSGSSPIYGDVLGTGDLISQGATPVYGNIHVNGNANFNGHVWGDLIVGGDTDIGTAATIEGSVRSGGYLNSGGRVTGKNSDSRAIAGGNAQFSSASTTAAVPVIAGGSVTIASTGSPPKSIRAAGTINYPSWFAPSVSRDYVGNLPPSELAIPPIIPVKSDDADCAAFEKDDSASDLAALFSKVRQAPDMTSLANWFDNHQCPYCYNESSSGLALTGGQGNKDASHTTIGTDKKQTFVHVVGNLSTQGRLQELTIKGDVTLLVDGNFTLTGATTLDVGESATLRLLVTGKTTLGSGTAVDSQSSFVRTNTQGKKQAAISLYTTYDSGNSSQAGVTISGANSSYVAVYAPKATVNLTGSGDIYGSVIAQKIAMSGSGDIHYDEALKKVTVGESGGSSAAEPSKAQIVGWWQE